MTPEAEPLQILMPWAGAPHMPWPLFDLLGSSSVCAETLFSLQNSELMFKALLAF